MLSRSDRRAALLLSVAALLAASPLRAQDPAPEPAEHATAAPTDGEIAAAVEKLGQDPNLVPERTIGSLLWRESPPASPDQSAWGSWLGQLATWIAGLFRWLAGSARVLVWVAAAVLAAMLAIYVTRVVRRFTLPARAPRFVAPSHVFDLDIRPESLPDDVGAAAAALWERGERRAALALLYRGLLSRLVHVYGVPIRDSSTEGDCLALAQPRLTAERNGYARRLIAVWQSAVYGALDPEPTAVAALCGGFAAALDPLPAPAAPDPARPSS